MYYYYYYNHNNNPKPQTLINLKPSTLNPRCLTPGEGQAALQDCEEPSRFWKFPFQGTS